MATPREIRRQERRKNRRPDSPAAAPAAAPARFSAFWLVVIAAVGGATIAGAVVMQMTRPPAAPQIAAPRVPAPVSMPAAPAPTFTPQPPGEAPPGKVWSPEHGHWHDLPPTQPPQ